MTGFRKLGGALAIAATSASLLGVAAAPAQAAPSASTASAAAASCYGSARTYYKPGGQFLSRAFTTTTACGDINVKSNQRTYVRVCFRRADIFSNCQANYTYVVPGQWAVVATNVLDNKDFLFDFYNDAPYSGLVAA